MLESQNLNEFDFTIVSEKERCNEEEGKKKSVIAARAKIIIQIERLRGHDVFFSFKRGKCHLEKQQKP